MTTLVPLQPHLYPEVYKIHSVTDTWAQLTIPDFIAHMSQCEGWVIYYNQSPVGYVVFNNLCPNHCVDVHASVLPEFHGKWLSKRIYKQIINFPFEFLQVKRLQTFLVEGYGNPTFLSRFGFKKEGTMRQSHQLPDGTLVDSSVYSMLPNERRWK